MLQQSDDIDALKRLVASRLELMQTALPGEIVSVDGALCAVRPAVDKTLTDGRVLSSPIIYNVPLGYLQADVVGAKAAISMPLKAGDGCLLVFSSRCIDDWIEGNRTPSDTRQFDLNDCMAIPAFNRPSTAVPYDSSALHMQYGGGSIKINSDGTILATTSQFTIDAAEAIITGNLTVNGKITAMDTIKSFVDVIFKTISGLSHRHTGVDAGSDTSGGPV